MDILNPVYSRYSFNINRNVPPATTAIVLITPPEEAGTTSYVKLGSLLFQPSVLTPGVQRIILSDGTTARDLVLDLTLPNCNNQVIYLDPHWQWELPAGSGGLTFQQPSTPILSRLTITGFTLPNNE